MSDNNRISLLEKHPNGFSFEIKEVTRGNEYSVTVLEEIGRGGGCIVYRGTVEKDMGLPLFDGPAVIKEFYPKALAEKGLSRSNDGIRLEIPEILTDDFEEQKDSFCKGQAKHIYFAGKHADKALSPASYSGKQNGTFYSVSDVSKGEVLSQKGRESFTIIDALKLATSICDVIGSLHTDTIPDEDGYESEYKGEYKLYLDCKPSNIFVDSNYNAYLFDFDTVQPLYRYEFCSYSEGWGAPEQKFKSEDEGYKDNMLIGFHTDMFSIGAVLLWLLTGIEGPTKEDLDAIENGFDWRTRITLKDPTGAKENEEFIENLDSLMRKLLKKSAEERKHLYPDEESAYRAMSELDLLEKIAKHVLTGKEIEKAKQEIIAEVKSVIKLSNNPKSGKTVHFEIPFRNDWFTGRQIEIETIENNFANGAHIQIIHGMGGMGKSQIAKEYLYRNMNQYQVIHWISATTAESIISRYKLFLKHVNALQEEASKDEVCQEYFEYLEKQDNWLIVYDGCDYYTDLEFKDFTQQCLPKNLSNGCVLITTRNKRPIGKAKRIEINRLSEGEAITFLLDRTGEEDKEGAGKLSKRLGCFPLALELAGAYIGATPQFGFREYLSCLKKNSKLFDRAIDVTDYDQSLAEVVLNTFEQIKKDCNKDVSKYVIELMKLFAFLSPKCLSSSIFEDIQREYYGHGYKLLNSLSRYCNDELNRNELIRTLVKYALLTEEPNGYFSIHELQQEVIRDSISQDKEEYILTAKNLIYSLGQDTYEHLLFNSRYIIDSFIQSNYSIETITLSKFQSISYEIWAHMFRMDPQLQDLSVNALYEYLESIIKCAKRANDLYFGIDERNKFHFILEYISIICDVLDVCVYDCKKIAYASTLIIQPLEAINQLCEKNSYEYVMTIDILNSDDVYCRILRASAASMVLPFVEHITMILVIWMLSGFYGGLYQERMKTYCKTILKLLDCYPAYKYFCTERRLDEKKIILESFINNNPSQIPDSYLASTTESQIDLKEIIDKLPDRDEYGHYIILEEPIKLPELYQELTEAFNQDFANLEKHK